jgi:hypothetical protein
MDRVTSGVVQVERGPNRDRTTEGTLMNDHDILLDRELDARLAALEARVPGRHEPPALPDPSRRGRFALSLAAAPLLALAMVATAAAGAVVIRQLVTAHEGIQNPGQPLAGAHMECLTPPEAAAFLAQRGYPDVVWQVEAGDPTKDGKGATTSTQRATPPEHGYVIPGSILDDGRPIMIIDQRVGATGVGDCFGQPMP